MASTKITLPATMKISAAAGEVVRFTPYKENFIVPVGGGESGSSLSLKSKTSSNISIILNIRNNCIV